jgi:hypothetical protein
LFIGQTASGSFQVCNYNSSPVTINSISINNSNFSVISGVGTVIPAVVNQFTPSCTTVGIQFAPQTTGTFDANILVNTTAQSPTYPCSGTGIPGGPTITTSSSGNGTITPSTSVNYGGNITITMTPLVGYTLNSLTDNGIAVAPAVGPSGTYTYTLTDVTSNHTIAATFGNLYAITTSSSGNGTITPSTQVSDESNVTITMTPSANYTLNSVTDNGTTVTASAGLSGTYTYTLSDVTVNHTIASSFRALYMVTAFVSGSGGSVYPTTAYNSYGCSANETFVFTPPTGYTLNSLTDNGVDVTSYAYVNYSKTAFLYNFNLANMNQDHTLQATYKVGQIQSSAAAPALSLPIVVALVTILSGMLYWKVVKKENV